MRRFHGYYSLYCAGSGGTAVLFVSYIIICGVPKRFKKGSTVSDDTVEIPLKKAAKAEEAPKPDLQAAAKSKVDDSTQIIPVKRNRPKPVRFEDDEEKTRVFNRKDFGESKAQDAFSSHLNKGPFPPEPEPHVLSSMPDLDSLEEYFVRHFLNWYGAVSTTVEQDTRKVTMHLIEGLHMKTRKPWIPSPILWCRKPCRMPSAPMS